MMSIQKYLGSIQKISINDLKIDSVLLLSILILIMTGLIILSSASSAISENNFGTPFHYLNRQLIAISIGSFFALICLYIPIFYWEKMGPFLLIIGLLLLLLVLLPGFGHTVNGSTRWLKMGIMNVQVSDPARLCIMIYVAGYLVRRNRQLREGFVGFLRPMIVLGLASLLLLLETDFGATAVLLVTVLSMLLVAGARIRDFLMFLIATASMLGLLVMQFPSRMRRFTGFLDPWDENVVYNAGYQLTQSLIAIGRGEWLGVGLGNSVQKLFYLNP